MHNARFMFGAAVMLALALMAGCGDDVVYETDPRLTNDLFHGAVVGTVVQKDSGALVIASQETAIDSAHVDPGTGVFELADLPVGNYVITIVAENFRTYELKNVVVTHGGRIYIGEIDLSTVPDLVATHYPEDLTEIVYDSRWQQLVVSITFTEPMNRESVETAFSTEPPTEGIFMWGQYATQPRDPYYGDDASKDGGRGGTITTFSKVTALTYRIARKDCFADTTYTVTLSTAARDTSGTHLRMPLEFSFSTVQSATTLDGIQTSPAHGDVDVPLMTLNGISLTFPRRMDPSTTERSAVMVPDDERIYIWPEENRLTIYTGGPFRADTTYTVTIGPEAEDLDGVALGEAFSFSFDTAAVSVESTVPRNGQLFVDPKSQVNTYMVRCTVQEAFSIEPPVSGSFRWGYRENETEKRAITFAPYTTLKPNTKYTVTIGTGARDMYGSGLDEETTFSFITMPE